MQDRERRVQQPTGRVILRRRSTKQRRRAAGRAGEQLGPFRRRCGEDRGLEQLSDDAVREVPLEFSAARAKRFQAELAAPAQGRQDQARLADARWALDQKKRPLADDRGTQPLIDPCESCVSLQKGLRATNSAHAPILRQQKSSVHW